jgi:hypothetical protein
MCLWIFEEITGGTLDAAGCGAEQPLFPELILSCCKSL